MLQRTWGRWREESCTIFACRCCGYVRSLSKMSRGQVATQHGGFCGAKSRRPPGVSSGSWKSPKSIQILRSWCWFLELAATRLRLCVSLLLLVYIDFFFTRILFIRSLAISTVLLVCFACQLMGFLQVGENQPRSHASPRSMLLDSFVYVRKVKR